MDKAVRLIDRSISAHHLEGHLADVLDRIDRLRLVQQPGRPAERPPWWSDHTRDSEWTARAKYLTLNCRQHRMAYAHWKVECAIRTALAGYVNLADGVEAGPAERAALKNAETALRSMSNILAGAQPCARLYWAVVPEASQLDRVIPKIYTPVLQSDHERWLVDQDDEICYRHVVLKELDNPTAVRMTNFIRRRVRKLADRRIAANRRLLQTMVTPEQHERILRLLEDWRRIVRQWELAEMGIRNALSVLRGEGPAVVEPPAPQACTVVEMGPAVLEMIRRLVAGEVAVVRGKKKTATSKAPDVRPWAQGELDAAIWKHVLAHEADIRNLERRLADPRTRDEAKKEAKQRWGPRPFARNLGVKSHAMVCQSPGWLVVAARLGLQQRAGAATARKGMEAVEDRVAQVIEPKPDEAAAARIDRAALDAALDKIPAEYRGPLRDQFLHREATLERVLEIALALANDGDP